MFKKVLVATDFSEAANAAMQCALGLSRQFGSTLHVIHVVIDPASVTWSAEAFAIPVDHIILQWQQQALREVNNQLPAAVRDQVVVVTPVGSPAAEIVKYAAQEGIDLIVVGTHGRGALDRWLLGSVAERVVRKAPCAVLTVRNAAPEL